MDVQKGVIWCVFYSEQQGVLLIRITFDSVVEWPAPDYVPPTFDTNSQHAVSASPRQIDADTLPDWRKTKTRLKIYDQFFDYLLRQQSHVRSA